MTKREECLKGLQCLYLEVDATIADDVKKRVLDALDEANNNCRVADVSGQLLAFLTWMKENKHRYMLSDETQFVDEFLKASNFR